MNENIETTTPTIALDETQPMVVETTAEDSSDLEQFLTEDEYALLYYGKAPKDYGHGSLWFFAAYVLFGLPLLLSVNVVTEWISQIVRNLVGPDAEAGNLNFSTEAFMVGAGIASVAIVLGILGILTAKDRGYQIWPSVLGAVGSATLLAVAWFFFV